MGADESTMAGKVEALAQEGKTTLEISNQLNIPFNQVTMIISALYMNGTVTRPPPESVHKVDMAGRLDRAINLYASGDTTKEVSEKMSITKTQAGYLRRTLIKEGRLKPRWTKTIKSDPTST